MRLSQVQSLTFQGWCCRGADALPKLPWQVFYEKVPVVRQEWNPAAGTNDARPLLHLPQKRCAVAGEAIRPTFSLSCRMSIAISAQEF